MTEPVQGTMRIWMGGRSWPVWYYDEPPEGVRPAALYDLIPGRAVLCEVMTGPFAGKWATDFVRASTREALAARIRDGGTVYIKI